ncbi:MAG TPA: TerC family protein [Bacteroidia bacterium]|jgi:tellurite resistance protein TerC|nr:TerC family protein [Bacteroidia bacterium]HQF27080.1 TerC family protein [Bacteroidia bacterium]HQK97992.1 TerC family protein [Bacteroidia bacterium]
MEPMSFWVGFNVFILALLVLDLVVLNKSDKEVSFKQSLLWVAFWSVIALMFNAWVYTVKGPEKAFEFLTGYVIEWSLSVDNLFVFIVIFSYFKVPKQYEYRVLFWGILGALILRGAFIVAGVAIFQMFTWMIYVFGGILLFTGVKMFFSGDDDDPSFDDNLLVRVCRKIFPITEDYHGKHFMVKQAGRWFATPLLLVLIVVDFTDLIFAVDSIPAVLAISKDSFIVYTSNVFAILGLRSLYFALSGMMNLFKYLKYGLAVILSFVGIKMLGSEFFHIPTVYALLVVLGVLAISILLSLNASNKESVK